jgi:8-oxo-dGTP diphosphatase
MRSCMAEPRPIPVACAIIADRQGLVLVAQRPEGKHLGLKWEFPGGKIEPGESPATALAREIREELGCEITADRALAPYVHTYEAVTIELHPFVCRVAEASPRPKPREHAAIAWSPLDRLSDYDFAAADLPLVQLLAEHGLEPPTAKAGPAGFRGLAAVVAAGCWIALIAIRPRAIFLQRTSALLPLVPVIGAAMLWAVTDLRRALRGLRDTLDEICLAFAAVPGLTLLAACGVRVLGFTEPQFLLTADWGMLFTFPGIMLAGTTLVRHGVLRAWSWLPALVGLALPVGLFAVQVGWHRTATVTAMLPASGWLVLGAAARRSTDPR